ncbi:cytochrome c biogenesis CcdA family protein [Paenibacillus pinihumi]|uniref:cytochrome c biogenesis CcdA family protein n=1 Tax=Paenibacillus pinihumi TaxID=669462 RepID=UPI0004165B15|nr:cytochrome c biogenesis protein CcdA [Paenibacillus pinihumi]
MTEQLYIGSVFAAGVLSFFSPCILPLLPVYLGYLGSSESGGHPQSWKLGWLRITPVLLLRTLLFMLGLSTVFVLLGFGAGALGNVLSSSWFITACGIVVILFGIYQTGVLKLSFLAKEKKLNMELPSKQKHFGAFLLGFTFSFGWTPCIGPVLAAIFSLSASEGSIGAGGFYMLIYTLGLGVPFLLMAVLSDSLLVQVRKIYKYMPVLKAVSGVVLIVMGLLLVTNKVDWLAANLQF